jgi:transcriptional regulator with XRE-family HTH domain
MWIKKRRRELGISLDKLAKRLKERGMPRTGAAIGNWEIKGHVPILSKPEEAEILAGALEMELAEMLLAAGFDLDLMVRNQAVPAQFVEFMEKYSDLTRQEQHLIWQMLTLMAEELIELRDGNSE